MKHTINLSIPNPCTEKWENFTPRPTGGFCTTCSKTVVDFTRMSDDQIIDFFKSKPDHTCGRLRADQLKSYMLKGPVKVNPGFTLFRAGLLSLFLLLAGKVAAQHVVVKQTTEVVQSDERMAMQESHANQDGFVISGIVKDDWAKEPIPGASIILKGTHVGISADSEGRFTFPQELNPGDVLIVSFIGYETLEYTVPKDFKEDEILVLLPMQQTLGSVAVVAGGIYIEQSRFQKWWSKVKSIF